MASIKIVFFMNATVYCVVLFACCRVGAHGRALIFGKQTLIITCVCLSPLKYCDVILCMLCFVTSYCHIVTVRWRITRVEIVAVTYENLSMWSYNMCLEFKLIYD